MFVDQIKVFAQAGKGGNGCVAFLREKYRPNGGPSGGNGGRGGDVILRADHDLNNLVDQYFKPRILAKPGKAGMGKEMDGRSGKDLIIRVPCGTLVWRLERPEPDLAPLEPVRKEPAEGESDVNAGTGDEATGDEATIIKTAQRPVIRHSGAAVGSEIDLSDDALDVGSYVPPEETAELIADLTEDGQEFLLCKGGKGGLGNKNFKSATRQTPRISTPGNPGFEGFFRLELRIVAEAGLVGYPNAGKSTLLTAVSHARPKVAAYPFTTLHPGIGIVEYDDYSRLTLCDVPGIIEGAHQNVGLGHAFLRHIMRCKILVLVIDMAGTDGRDPWDDYDSLLHELGEYHESLLTRPRLVVCNKVDEPAAEENIKIFKEKTGVADVQEVSAAFDIGIDAFKERIRAAVNDSSEKD
ncbi:MAG: GTP-binding protein [Limisphaerales bacterium]|jgi:GTP-binding protein